jgi:hypothetical protein
MKLNSEEIDAVDWAIAYRLARLEEAGLKDCRCWGLLNSAKAKLATMREEGEE